MKAALFVSKFLKSKELANLNGVDEVVLENPRNRFSLPYLVNIEAYATCQKAKKDHSTSIKMIFSSCFTTSSDFFSYK